jgi:hypothetical protein
MYSFEAMKGQTHTIPVRLDPPLHTRVEEAARRLDSTCGDVVRLAIVVQLDRLEAGAIRLPSKSVQVVG